MKEEKETKLKKIGGIMLTLLVMLTLTFNIQHTRTQKEKIVIGVAESLTGPFAGAVAIHHVYYDMIVEDYNAKGGLYVPEYGKRLPIELLKYDDESNLEKCLTLIEKLITEDKVDLLFAPWSTAFCIAALPLFEQYKYPVVGLTVGSNTLSDLLQAGTYRYFFVTLGQPREDAEELVDLITYINGKVAPDLKISRVGFTYRSDEHGIEHAEALRDGVTAMGIEVPVYESYVPYPPPANWAPTITSFRDADVDAVIFCGYTESADFIHQCITQDYNPKMLMVGPGMETPLVYDVFGFTPGEMAGICYYDGFPATTYNTPELQAWVAHHVEYTKAHIGSGFKPFPASGVFYSGLECLFKAVEKHGLNREAIRDALATEEFDTIVGKFKFRPGLSPVVEGHGTLTQWHGKEMMDVIWPLSAASEPIIYPKYPWSWAKVPDINRDGVVDIFDVLPFSPAYGSRPGDPGWNPLCDLMRDNVIDDFDVKMVWRMMGWEIEYGGPVEYYGGPVEWRLNITIDHLIRGLESHTVTILSDYIVYSNYSFNYLTAELIFDITSSIDGFCNITIPRELLTGAFRVELDNATVPSILTWDGTHTFVYFNSTQLSHKVKIVGNTPGDINGDGIVDIFDVVFVATHFEDPLRILAVYYGPHF